MDVSGRLRNIHSEVSFRKATVPCEHTSSRYPTFQDHARAQVFFSVMPVATRRSSRTAAHADQVEASRA